MSLRPYPKYKPSGVQWLGDVPEHWDVKRLGHHLTRNDSGVWGTEADRQGTIVLRSTEQTVGGGWRIDEPAVRLLPEVDRIAHRLVTGDLVVAKSSGSALHIGKSSLVTEEVEKLDAGFSNFMQRLRCANSLNPRLAQYLLNCPAGRQQLVFLSNTTTGLANLSGSMLSEIRLACPRNVDEQRAIADYLDWQAGKLDRRIGTTQTASERLREKRCALITRAVTCGLPEEEARAAGFAPNPPLRASGIEWLGDLPAHWKVMRLGSVVRNTEQKEEPDESVEYPYIGMEQVESRTGRLLDGDPDFTPLGVSNRFLAGDILYGKLRPYLAKACCVDFDGLCSSELMTLRAKRGMDRRFLLFNLISGSFTELMDACSYGTKMPRTSWEIMKACVIAVPGVGEQRAIADYLDRETAKLDELIGRVETAIERLREYRSALITAVVTGKVDVRGASGETGRAEAE